MDSKRKVKKVRKHLASGEIAELNNVKILVVEFDDLLEQLGAGSIGEFELKVNEKTKFTNPVLSASAFGLENEYKRLLELEKLIDNRLTSEDLTPSKELKSTLIATIYEKHTEYYNNEELESKKLLESIMKSYNKLSQIQRQQIGFNRSYELVYSPFSELKH
jgi:hypothetical protein